MFRGGGGESREVTFFHPLCPTVPVVVLAFLCSLMSGLLYYIPVCYLGFFFLLGSASNKQQSGWWLDQ